MLYCMLFNNVWKKHSFAFMYKQNSETSRQHSYLYLNFKNFMKLSDVISCSIRMRFMVNGHSIIDLQQTD